MDEATGVRTGAGTLAPWLAATLVAGMFVALPVVGVAVISQLATPVIASTAFALTIAVFAIAALFSGSRQAPT